MGLGNGIVAAAPERVTAEQASQAEPPAADRPVAPHRFEGIRRAARREAAGGREGRRGDLVSADESADRASRPEGYRGKCAYHVARSA